MATLKCRTKETYQLKHSGVDPRPTGADVKYQPSVLLLC